MSAVPTLQTRVSPLVPTMSMLALGSDCLLISELSRHSGLYSGSLWQVYSNLDRAEKREKERKRKGEIRSLCLVLQGLRQAISRLRFSLLRLIALGVTVMCDASEGVLFVSIFSMT